MKGLPTRGLPSSGMPSKRFVIWGDMTQGEYVAYRLGHCHAELERWIDMQHCYGGYSVEYVAAMVGNSAGHYMGWALQLSRLQEHKQVKPSGDVGRITKTPTSAADILATSAERVMRACQNCNREFETHRLAKDDERGVLLWCEGDGDSLYEEVAKQREPKPGHRRGKTRGL